jgi:hypothetical protein
MRAETRKVTALHEAGHAVVARAVGIRVFSAAIEAHGESGHIRREFGAGLVSLRASLAATLAGRLAEALAAGRDWRTVPLAAVLRLEERHFRYLDAVADALAAEGAEHPRLAAYHWLDEAVPRAGAYAARILAAEWGDVLELAGELVERGEVEFDVAAGVR